MFYGHYRVKFLKYLLQFQYFVVSSDDFKRDYWSDENATFAARLSFKQTNPNRQYYLCCTIRLKNHKLQTLKRK